jgi:hypothetical protein
MANFQTHFNTAAFISAISSSMMYYNKLTNKTDSILLFGAGIIGGILPDIDSNYSIPTKIMQYIFANLISFLIVFRYIGIYPILNIILIWIGSFMSIIILFQLFNKITTHRGMFHSIPAAFIFWFTFSLISYYIFQFNYIISWYLGMFIFLGYITHLVLDEIYSIDIANKKIKKSFGTALKFWNKDIKSVIFFYTLVILLFIAMPHKQDIFNSLAKFDIITNYHKLLRKYER